MAERMTLDFEARLADAFERYVAPAPVAVDARSVARELVVAASVRPSLGLRWGAAPGGRRLAVLAAVALLATATIVAVAVGSRLLDRPAPRPLLGVVERTGSLLAPRSGATLAVLGDGRVLVVGGSDGGEGVAYRRGELWDPSTNAFTKTAYGTPIVKAIALADGRVLGIGEQARTYDVYDPGTGSGTRCCEMGDFTTTPSAALLPDGRVLLVGGDTDRSARLFDPATYTSSPTGPMTAERSDPQAISLQDGRVLILGGGPQSAELYDPATATFTPIDSPLPPLGGPAVLLSDGRVLVPGTRRFERTAPAIVYDPAAGRFETAAPTPNHVVGAVALDDGRALLIGDYDGPVAGDGTWAVLYDPEDGVVRELPPPTAHHPSLVRLPDGRVLLAGGYDIKSGATLDVAEIYR